jgi:hypothetical protein
MSIEDCQTLAFENQYTYVGLKKGGECGGSNQEVGKYGKSTKCNYKCLNGIDICGGKNENTIF